MYRPLLFIVLLCGLTEAMADQASTSESDTSTRSGDVATATSEPPNPSGCAGIDNDAARLSCYDSALGHRPDKPAPSPAQTGLFRFEHTDNQDDRQTDKQANGSTQSLLESRWELVREDKLGLFNIRTYQPVYILPLFYSNNVNETPSSPTPGRTVTSPLDIQSVETKYQLSFKTKVLQDVLGGDLWFGYTQASHWQLYNSATSRPFRESDYEPELMMVFATDYHVLGWHGRLLSFGILHQSNGRSNPFSRSWNRLTFSAGLEREDWTLTLRPWLRVPERSADDDNPDISDYMGRGDLQLVHESNGNEYALMLRHSLRGGDNSHGAVEFNWAFPIQDKLKGYLQIFNGYGESLIDYNHKALYLGLGVSLVEWY